MRINDDDIIEAVKCFNCGTLHEKDSENFVRIAGNIMIGMNGGIVGNNFEELKNNEGKAVLKKSTYICRSRGCLEDLFIKRILREQESPKEF